jgi:hypothetical protein
MCRLLRHGFTSLPAHCYNLQTLRPQGRRASPRYHPASPTCRDARGRCNGRYPSPATDPSLALLPGEFGTFPVADSQPPSALWRERGAYYSCSSLLPCKTRTGEAGATRPLELLSASYGTLYHTVFLGHLQATRWRWPAAGRAGSR